MICSSLFFFFFFFNDTATTEIYTLSLHDALPIFFHQLLDVPGTTIGEFSLGQRPDAFIGVEVRRVGGKMLDFETRVSSTKFLDRKSTRLNSSHGYISYAVFCLKKKKKKNHTDDSSSNIKFALPLCTLRIVEQLIQSIHSSSCINTATCT